MCRNTAFSRVLDSRLSLPFLPIVTTPKKVVISPEACQHSLEARSEPVGTVIAFWRFSRLLIEFLRMTTAGTWASVLRGLTLSWYFCVVKVIFRLDNRARPRDPE